MNTQITTTSNTRNLPALPIREAEKTGAQILATLDRLGFTHKDLDGRVFSVCIEDATLWGDSWVSLRVDVQRLWHFDVLALASEKVKATLQSVTKREVIILLDPCLTYAVRLKRAEPARRLPHRIDLDLEQRPDGDYMIGFGLGRNGLVWRELSKLTHVIVAGSSDSGKSAFLRSLVYQFAKQPLPVELYLTDLEGLTFAWAADWPMLKMPIAQDVSGATEITRCLLAEIDRRAQLYFSTGKFPESLAEYHKYSDDRLPWLVAIFDEFSALVEEAGKGSELVKNISQLAMRGRKFGMTLVFAGQDFKADLLNTRITNQLKTRVQFRSATRVQSEVVLGQGGAESITIPGRAFVRIDGDVMEVQSFWVDKSLVIGDVPQAKAALALSDLECELVHHAVDNLGGAFKVNTLARAFAGQGMTNRKVAELARRWERKGWLTHPKHATDSRKITPELATLAGLTG